MATLTDMTVGDWIDLDDGGRIVRVERTGEGGWTVWADRDGTEVVVGKVTYSRMTQWQLAPTTVGQRGGFFGTEEGVVYAIRGWR